MAEPNLFEPTLQEGNKHELDTFSILGFFAIAMIGGFPSAVIIGWINGRTLKMGRAITYGLVAAGILIIMVKFIVQVTVGHASVVFWFILAIYVMSQLRMMRRKILFRMARGEKLRSPWKAGALIVLAGWGIDIILAMIARGLHG